VPSPDGCSELEKIAIRFEEKIYAHAISQVTICPTSNSMIILF
jgi:hypothetical protein